MLGLLQHGHLVESRSSQRRLVVLDVKQEALNKFVELGPLPAPLQALTLCIRLYSRTFSLSISFKLSQIIPMPSYRAIAVDYK